MSWDGSTAWRKIHAKPLEPITDDTVAWFVDLVMTKVGACGSCRRKSVLYLVKNPPDVTDQRSLAAWGWRWHNHVNQHEVTPPKPTMSWEDAVKIHGWPAEWNY